jgi:hypothetical protein
MELISRMEKMQLSSSVFSETKKATNSKVLMVHVHGASNLANRDEFSLSDTYVLLLCV